MWSSPHALACKPYENGSRIHSRRARAALYQSSLKLGVVSIGVGLSRRDQSALRQDLNFGLPEECVGDHFHHLKDWGRDILATIAKRT